MCEFNPNKFILNLVKDADMTNLVIIGTWIEAVRSVYSIYKIRDKQDFGFLRNVSFSI